MLGEGHGQAPRHSAHLSPLPGHPYSKGWNFSLEITTRPHQGILVNMFSRSQAVEETGEAKRETRTVGRKQRLGQLRGKVSTGFRMAALRNWEWQEGNTRLLAQGLSSGQGQPKDGECQA